MAQSYMIDFTAGLKDDLKKRINGIDDPVVSARIHKEIGKIIEEESENSNKSASKFLIEVLKDPYRLVEKYSNYLLSSNKSNNTINDYCSEANKFINFMVKEKINLIDLDSVREYFAYQKKVRRLCSNGFRKLFFSIKSFLWYLMEAGLVHFDLKKIKPPKKIDNSQDYATEKDIKKIRDYLAKGKERFKNGNLRDWVIIYLLLCCGLRRQELINLDWEDIDFYNKILKVWRSKGGKSRVIPFGSGLHRLLTKYHKSFGFYKGAVVRGIQSRKRICKASLQNKVRSIYKGAGVYRKGLKIHSLRHSYATKVNREAGTRTAQERLGHSRLDTTEKYLHLDEDDLKKGIIDFPLPEIDENHKN